MSRKGVVYEVARTFFALFSEVVIKYKDDGRKYVGYELWTPSFALAARTILDDSFTLQSSEVKKVKRSRLDMPLIMKPR